MTIASPAIQRPEVHAHASKLMLRGTPQAALDDGTPVQRVMLFGTIDDGYVAKDVGEQIWHCDVTLRPTSRRVMAAGYPGTEVGGGGEIKMPARLFLRNAIKIGGQNTLMVAGCAIGDPRTYPAFGKESGIDEIVQGTVDIVPIKRWDATEAFGGYGASDAMTSWQIAHPDGLHGSSGLPVLTP